MTAYDPIAEPSEYERLINGDMLYSRSRRSALTDEERRRRRRASSRLSMEARRRAVSVLISKHQDEYDAVYEQENLALRMDPKYRLD